MKKKLLLSIAISLLVISIISDQYLKQSFQLSLVEYINALQPFTDEEQSILSSISVITYGSDSNSPPLRYVDPKTYQYKGLVVDYLDALSIELETPIDFTPLIWSEALSALSEGTIDICDMYPSKERAAYYDFSIPFYYQRGVILTRASSPVQRGEDISSHQIAGTNGDYAFEYLKSNYPKGKSVAVQDLEAAIDLLKGGAVDAVLGDESVITYFLEKEALNDDFYIADGFLYEQKAVLAVKKGNNDLLSILNKGITRLKTKSTMEKIHQKWYGTQPLITKNTQELKWQFIFQLLFITSCLSVTLLYFWNRSLSNEVNKQTKELIASGQVLEATFDGLRQFLLVLDKDKRIIEINKSYCDYHKRAKSEIKGLYLSDLPELMQNDVLNNHINTLLLDHKSFIIDFNHLKRSYQGSGHPISSKNEPFKLLLFIEDITDQVAQQQQLLQSRKMVAVGQLAAGVAHEIRNPIGLIRNHSFLLKRQLESTSNNDILESLNTIDHSIDRVNSIINNLLNFSRINSGDQKMINIKKFTTNIVDLNKELFEKKNTHFILRCSDSISVAISEESLKHIFINLITNSLDALQKNGTITIDINIEMDDLIIKFHDNGIGIKPEHIGKLFDPFFTTKSPEDGTGLGLYIVYNEITKLNGSIKVISNAQDGTTFTCTLPTLSKNSLPEGTYE